MRNVLSQEEIDSLLQSLESGEVETQGQQEQTKAKKYDFRRPNRFSKANMGFLSMIHDNFARHAANFLSAYLRANVSAKVASVDQVAFSDVVVSLPSNTISTLFSIAGKGVALLQGGADIVIPVIDLVCGGTGEPVRRSRQLTDIEIAIYARLSKYMLDRYELAWKDTATIECRYDSIEVNPRLIHAVSPDEMVAVITLTLTVNSLQGLLTVCLPFNTANTLINRPASAVKEEDEVTLQQRWEARKALLGDSTLSVAAILGETDLSVGEFLHLQIGDVIAVTRKPGEPVNLLVEGKDAFYAQPGLIGSHLAVQIVPAPVEEED
jgi:flagellar motor switch protein FliM